MAVDATSGKGRTLPAGRTRPARVRAVRVTITAQAGAAALPLFERALVEAGLWSHLGRAQRARGGRRRDFSIVIKPDLDVFGAPADSELPIEAASGTDPALVEHLIDLLHARGFARVAVIDGRNEADSWLHNRDPLVVPDLVGYRFATRRGHAYEIVAPDAAAGTDGVLAEAADGSSPAVPGELPLAAAWTDAHYRINFAKNRTHEDSLYALCLRNLAGLIASADGARAARRPSDLPDDCLAVLRRAPPHFNLIDAYVSCHGGAGQRAPRPMLTHTFIGSPDTLLADWAGAAKMGLDPFISPVNAQALRTVGLPSPHAIDGDLAPYRLWRNVHPLIARCARQRNDAGELGRIAAGWFQSIDRERFAPRDFYNDRINAFIAPVMARIDDNARSFWTIVLIDQLIARIGALVLAQQTLFAKDRLQRRVAPLLIDLAEHDAGAFDAIAAWLAPYERLLQDCPPNRDGLRWRQVDRSILFSCSHVFPIAFERFTAAVDITRTIQYMNDYIGGCTVAVRRDRRGRVVHQAERNLYLQQPNWMVLFGGEVIDVEKLEAIRYGRDRQTLHWRSVGSPNGSALHDDGCVSFIRSGEGETTVHVFARQQFTLPLFFQAIEVELFPGFRDPIVEAAYGAFFSGTIANLQAAFEGREFRIGRPAPVADAAGATPTGELPRYLATGAAAVAELLRHRGDVADLGQWLFGRPPDADASPAGAGTAIDPDGFRHFAGSPEGSTDPAASAKAQAMLAGLAALARDAPEILGGLAEAVQLDLERMAGDTAGGEPDAGTNTEPDAAGFAPTPVRSR